MDGLPFFKELIIFLLFLFVTNINLKHCLHNTDFFPLYLAYKYLIFLVNHSKYTSKPVYTYIKIINKFSFILNRD